MSRCSNCGRQSPQGSTYCLGCGSKLACAAPPPAAAPPEGILCPQCAVQNPPGMNFCRSCGSMLVPARPPAASAPALPMQGRAQASPHVRPPLTPPAGTPLAGAALARPSPAPAAVAAPPRPGSPVPAGGGSVLGPTGTGPRPGASVGTMPAPNDVVGRRVSSSPPWPAGAPGAASGRPDAGPPAAQACPHCGSQTPAGFAFCQQCGRRLPQPGSLRPSQSPPPVTGELAPAMAPTMIGATADPEVAAARRDRSVSLQPTELVPKVSVAAPVDASLSAPASVASPWGVLVSINQDGSDGARHVLTGEWIEIGRGDADIAFAGDCCLALRHARVEQGAEGAPFEPRLVPLDRLNGVYRRISEPTPLAEGAVFLVGREVMRFEPVDDQERLATPLVRHGVTLFGSPPREPWGRLCQLLANGGIRDVRHLCAPAVTIGREEGEVVFRDDGFLSRRHATLSWRDGGCVLEDLSSSNGTFVRLTGPLALRSGDEFRMGDQLFRFERSR